MRKTEKNLSLLRMIFAVGLVISNVVTAKLVDLDLNLFGTKVLLPGAALCYAITFLMTDVIGETWGRKEANDTVLFGFVCQLLASVLIAFTQLLPTNDPSVQLAYETLLGTNYIFVAGSLVAYFASQLWDVYIFHRIRKACMARGGGTSSRWIWNNVSTMTSQIIDTVLFIGISFGIGFGWLFSSETLPALGAMMLGQYALKFVLALFDTPFFYALTRRRA